MLLHATHRFGALHLSLHSRTAVTLACSISSIATACASSSPFSSSSCPLHSHRLHINSFTSPHHQRNFSSSSQIDDAEPQATTPTSASSSSSSPSQPLIYTHRFPRKKSNFRDRVRLHVSGGRGGAGCSSYDTDPYGKGGPDGANGGRGGDVYLVSTDNLSVLAMESLHLRGQHGQSGGSKLAKGRNGYSLKVPIPSGTVVSEILATDPIAGSYTLKFIADMSSSGLEIKVASGGAGGLGNRAFKTKYRKQSRFSTIGQYGSERWLYLELKSIADVGLVGYPNAGKSSFLAAISNATPEIANYPFTTLHPQVGVVEVPPEAFSSFNSDTTSASPSVDSLRLTVADLPGLISGASENRGLGHEFLKHIQRTRVLCYVLDISGNDDRDPVDDFLSLRKELELFDASLLHKPSIILANKVDNTEKNNHSYMRERIESIRAITDIPVYLTSCLHKQGMKDVVSQLARIVVQQRQDEHAHRLAMMQEEVKHEIEIEEERKRRKEEMMIEKQKFLEEDFAEEEEEQDEDAHDDAPDMKKSSRSSKQPKQIDVTKTKKKGTGKR